MGVIVKSFPKDEIKHLKKDHPETDNEISDDLGVTTTLFTRNWFCLGLHFKYATD